ncbi:cytochrome P450 6j1-like [Zootermopsis nevadensis]|uniref:cytochrome P450 6j1-like n=1 Tax=Zootermopsis nevadensis TaxID=136037 RepID=UPI000B8E9EC0|nr:cytochrome P450 6j1-like [Zootermopsis nevadensis]
MPPIFLSLTLSLITVLSVLFIYLYYYFTRNFNFWKNLGISYVKPLPFVGNLKEVVFLKENIGKALQRIYSEHSDKPYVGIFAFDEPSLLIRDLDMVKNILVKDAQNFLDRSITVDEDVEPLLGKTMFVTKGQRWRRIRVKLTPVFTTAKIKMMLYLVELCGKDLVKYLDKVTADGTPVDVKETMARFTTDVIASCAFGINSNSLKNPDAEFRRHLRNALDFTFIKGLAGLTAFFAPNLKRSLKLKFVDDYTTNYIRNTIWNTVDYREKNEVIRNDFLDSMIEMRNKWKRSVQEDKTPAKSQENDSHFEIDGDEFVAQAFLFLAAGLETSATVLSFALYELALHSEIQQRLRAEMTQVLDKHHGELTYDGIREMSYLDMVVRETLRKYPVLPFLDRRCARDYELPSPSGKETIILPAGTAVYISVVGIQNDPKYFPEGEKFLPERFTEENIKSRPSYTYLPFGEGLRMCMGMRFGLMQVKTGLIHIFSAYEVAPCEETPVPISYDSKSLLLRANGEVPLSFKRL